jgi:hypothetical protein
MVRSRAGTTCTQTDSRDKLATAQHELDKQAWCTVLLQAQQAGKTAYRRGCQHTSLPRDSVHQKRGLHSYQGPSNH